jgi:metal-responsive CopG/Arc/MetJ family transcriptional regulator
MSTPIPSKRSVLLNIPETLLNALDAVVQLDDTPNRSHTIRCAVREYVEKHTVKQKKPAKRPGWDPTWDVA